MEDLQITRFRSAVIKLFRQQHAGKPLNLAPMDHLAIPVRDQARSRRFYEKYFGFDARPANVMTMAF